MSISVKWGLITGMVYVIFSLISNMLGIQQGGGGSPVLGILMNILIMVITFFTIYLGIKESRDQESGGYLTMGQAFKKGMAIALIAGVLAGIFSFIYMKFIDPEMIDRVMEGYEDQWDTMNVPEEQREMSRKITGIFMNPAILTPFMILWVAFWGIFKSLIAGAMLKKDAPPTLPIV